jgi:hypothetical protein
MPKMPRIPKLKKKKVAVSSQKKAVMVGIGKCEIMQRAKLICFALCATARKI